MLENLGTLFQSIIIGFCFLGIYFAPAIIAEKRNHPKKMDILLLNVFAATIILWIIPLIWSLRKIQKDNPTPTPPNKDDKLATLKHLHEHGMIPDEVFNQKKAELKDS